ncbi:MAG: universal stress protein, partial [Planctomycetaceae bacterium]
MHRCRHLLVGLARTEADAGLIRYAARLARLGAAVEFRFVHVLPTRPDESEEQHHRDHVLAGLEADIRDAFADVPDVVKTYCNVLKGPLTDRLLQFAAEQEVDLILIGHRRDHSG